MLYRFINPGINPYGALDIPEATTEMPGLMSAADKARLLGAFSFSVLRKTSAYTAVAGDIVLGDTSDGSFAITLPNAATNEDAQIVVKKVSADGNILTVQGISDQSIDGF